LHWYALCAALGVLIGLWLTEHRYRTAGGRPGQVLDLALIAVPAALAGARAQRVLLDSQLQAAVARDWVEFFRVWDGGLGLPGALLAVAPVLWWWCRRRSVALGPVLAAGAPGLAFGHAVFVWGYWFTRNWYGRPSALPWAVQISPLLRVPGYQAFSSFQPLFLYESAWDAVSGVVALIVISRFALRGDRALALAAGLVAAGWFSVSVLFGAPPRLGGSWGELGIAFGVAAIAAAYLMLTSGQRGGERLEGQVRQLARSRMARPFAG
jgi:prolipoprotein diacylglyceryl transferase